MDSFAQKVGAVAMLLAAVTIVVVNDRLKERAQRKAIAKGRRPPARWAKHDTSWPLVASYVVLAGLFLLVAALAPGRAMSRWVLCLIVVGAMGLVAFGQWVWRRARSGRSDQPAVTTPPRDAVDPSHALASRADRSSIAAGKAAATVPLSWGALIRIAIDAIRSRRSPTIVWSSDGQTAKLKCPRCNRLVELRVGAKGERAFECSSCGESGVWQDVSSP
jgi:hypothetical protein